MSLIDTLKVRRNQVWHETKALIDSVEAQKRAQMNGEEEQTFQRLNAELDSIDERIRELESQEKREADINDAMARVTSTAPRGMHVSAADRDLDTAFRRAAAQNLRTPIDVVPLQRRSGWRPGIERRTVTTVSGSGMTGTTFHDRIVRHMVEGSAVLAAGATLLQTDTGEAYRVPKSTAFSTAAIVSEGGTIATSDPTLGTASLTAYKYGFMVQVSTDVNDN